MTERNIAQTRVNMQGTLLIRVHHTTDLRGARWCAVGPAGARATVAQDYAIDGVDNAVRAAQAYVVRHTSCPDAYVYITYAHHGGYYFVIFAPVLARGLARGVTKKKRTRAKKNTRP